MKNVSLKVAEEIKLLSGSERAFKVIGVGAGGDESRYVDVVAEETVIRLLKNYGKPCVFVGEENGVIKIFDEKPPEAYVLVDGLDGTNNFLRGIPFYAVSLAVAEKPTLSSVYAAVVLEVSSGKLFYAEKGKGSWLNGKRIKPSSVEDFKNAIISVDIPPSGEALEKSLKIAKNSNHLRRLGAVSLEVCYIAAGMIDVHVDLKGRVRVVDLAAAYLILKEAGGLIVDGDGKELDIPADLPTRRTTVVSAANPNLLEKVFKLFKS
ncbi:MAG: inositol monophosphatase family protein [Candidatus Bathyarchaeota archaeon]